jgi:exodeoxyribonuclease-1
MSNPTFLWHDYETWGADPKVDRPSQFAAIRTDVDLKPVGKPIMLYCRPSLDCLPHPEAVLITGITPQQAEQKGLNEATFFKKIQAEFAQSNTCGVGYNSLRFDDEVTRFGFYRNFIDPYAHTWQNGNSRWDILDLMRMTYALRPEGINWPTREDGSASFKLEHLTAANNIEHSGAHDALADVEATIALAKLVKQKQPRLFDFYFGLRQKAQAASHLSLPQHKVVLHMSGMFPAYQGCLAPMVPLIQHPTNKNEIICYNLRVSPSDFLKLSADQIRDKLYTPRLNLAEGEQRIALKGIHINKSPALAPVNTLTDAQAQRWKINWSQIKQNYQLLMADQNLKNKLIQVYTQQGEFPVKDADSDLYSGFISHTDRQRCQQLLGLDPEQVLTWKSDYFNDPRLQTLLPRYQARNYTEHLDEAAALRWQKFCQARLIEGEFDCHLTLEKFQQELMTLVQSQNGEREQALLAQLSEWVQQRFS